MKRAATILLAMAVFLLCCASLPAQSADSIIDRHIKALGGKKALQKISGVRFTGSATRNGAAAPGEFLWQAKAPGSTYLEMRWEGARLIEACNNRSAWRDDGASGPRTLSGREQARARAAARFRNDHFLTYKKEKTKVQLLGRDSVAGRGALVVEMTTRAGLRRKLYFDAENYLLLKEESELENGREEILYSDHRALDGVKEPYRIQMRRGADWMDIAVREVMHNASGDAKLFDFPAAAGRPLPDLYTMLKQVEKNQEALNKIRENYTFTSTETEIELDDKGNIKQKSEQTHEVYYFFGGQVKKLIKKDGRPLSDSAQRKEDERIEKQIKQLEKRHKEAEEKKKQPPEANAKKNAKDGDEDDDDIGIADFLRIARIQNPRRERFRGRDVVLYEFDANPGYKPRNRAESIVQKLAGMIWIDEEAKEVARLEARMTDSFRVGGGLVASLGKGAEFVFEQDRINNEIWLPRYVEVNLTARVLLVKGVKIHRIEQYSDYKKFNVETRMEAKPPAPEKQPD